MHRMSKIKLSKSQLRQIIKEELHTNAIPIYLRANPVPSHIFERTYVTDVLGIHLPLNESYPYSPAIEKRIIQEQLLLEGFFSDIVQKGKDKLIDAVEGVKKFGKEAWSVLSAFYAVVKEGGSAIASFTSAIAKRGINKFFNPLKEALEWLTSKLPDWDMPTFAKMAQKGLDIINDIQKMLDSTDGWKRIAAYASAAIGLQWVWNKVGDWIDELKEMVGGDFTAAMGLSEQEDDDSNINKIKSWIKETAKEAMSNLVGGQFTDILKKLASATGVTAWWDMAKKAGEGAKLVIDALGGAAARFLGQQSLEKSMPGQNESIIRGKTMKVTKRQLRSIIREAGLWDNVHNKRKEGRSPAKKGEEGYPDEKSWKAAQEGEYSEGDVLDETEDTQVESYKEGRIKITTRQLKKIIRETIIQEDKSGKGKCPDTGCIRKGKGGWKIVSNKTGKNWPQTYETKEKAENALDAYHASRG